MVQVKLSCYGKPNSEPSQYFQGATKELGLMLKSKLNLFV